MDDFKILVESPTETDPCLEKSISTEHQQPIKKPGDPPQKHPRRGSLCGPHGERLSIKNSKDISDFLSAVRQPAEKFKKDFYAEPIPTRSWVQLQNDDVAEAIISSHHRSDLFPQTWHPLGHSPSSSSSPPPTQSSLSPSAAAAQTPSLSPLAPPPSSSLSPLVVASRAGKNKSSHHHKVSKSKTNHSERHGKAKKLATNKSDHNLPTPQATTTTTTTAATTTTTTNTTSAIANTAAAAAATTTTTTTTTASNNITNNHNHHHHDDVREGGTDNSFVKFFIPNEPNDDDHHHHHDFLRHNADGDVIDAGAITAANLSSKQYGSDSVTHPDVNQQEQQEQQQQHQQHQQQQHQQHQQQQQQPPSSSSLISSPSSSSPLSSTVRYNVMSDQSIKSALKSSTTTSASTQPASVSSLRRSSGDYGGDHGSGGSADRGDRGGKSGSSAKVAFILGADDIEMTEPTSSSSPPPQTSNNRSSHKLVKPSRYGSRYKSGSRVFGSDVYLEGQKHFRSYSTPVEGADDLTEENIRHLNVMASHRFCNQKGLRHRKIDKKSFTASSSSSASSNKDAGSSRKMDKRLLDVVIKEHDCDQQQQQHHRRRYLPHQHDDYGFEAIPEEDSVVHHEMFVELDELHQGDNDEWEWRERARWIKYEEDVEEDAKKWGKPHVSSMSFHSLVELRKCIELGAVMLDLEAQDLPSIASRIVDQLLLTEQLEEDDKQLVLQALLLKHSRLPDQQSFLKRSHYNHNLNGLTSSQTTPSHMCNSFTNNSNNNNNNTRINVAYFNNNNNNNNNSNNNNSNNNNCNNNNNFDDDDDDKDVDSMKKLLSDKSTTTSATAAVMTSAAVTSSAVTSLAVTTSAVTFSAVTSLAARQQQQQPPSSSSSSSPFRVPLLKIKESKTADISSLCKMDQTLKQTPSSHSLPSSSPINSNATPASKYTDGTPQIWKRIPTGAEATNVLVGTVDFLKSPVAAFVRLKEAVYLGDVTEVPLPVRFIFLLMGPENPSLDYHEVGRSLSTLMADEHFHDTAYVAAHRSDILDSLNDFLKDSVVLPPGEWDKATLLPIVNITRRKQKEKKERKKKKIKKLKGPPSYDPLKRQGRLFGGLVEDMKHRYPHYLSDVLDGLNLQCLAALIFVYFACLSPAITFGGLLGEKTDKLMGVNEMLIATAICGVIFSLGAGQPLIIIGATGPVLVFEEALYKICVMMSIEFLPFRFWVGIWVSVICTVAVALEGSVLVRYITRFTEEIFALLISLIFIYEVFKKLFYIFKKNPLLEYYPHPNDTRFLYFDDNNNINNNINNNSYFDNNTYHINNNYDNNNNNNSFIRIKRDSPNINNNNNYHTSATTSIMMLSDILLPSYHNNNNNNNNNNYSNDFNSPSYDKFNTTGMYNDTELLDSIIDTDSSGHSYYPHPNTALLSVILTFGTFLLAYALKKFRNSTFLGRNARRAIGDFGVPISIMVVALIDYLIPNTYTEKLDVPEGFTPTAPHKRSWVINPLGSSTTLSPWLMFGAIVPSVLIFILLYMESVITSMIVNKKDRLLKKGSGYHLDLFVTGLCASICGLLGLPFMCSATVRSVTHVSALSVYSRTHAPGVKPHLVKVVEQRVTSLAVHLLVGVSVLMGPMLKQVPLAVLFGIFLYMGIASMTGIQLVKRCKLAFMPVKHHPDVGYVKRVRLRKMNLFTFLQLLFLAILWIVKSTKAALAFPFILILIIPIRIFAFKWIFTELELHELDKEEDCPSEDEEVEPDFYTQAHMPI